MEKKKKKKISNRGVGAVWPQETHAPGKANKSQHQHDFLQGGLGLLPHDEGRVIAPCSEPASPHKPYNTQQVHPKDYVTGMLKTSPQCFFQPSAFWPAPCPHSSLGPFLKLLLPPSPPSSPVISHPLILPSPSTSHNWITV